jgi:hypothetical protein
VTGAAALERRYRLLLACYPRRFRDESGEEMIGVLMAGSRLGQRRPGLAETADVAASGLLMRLRPDPSQAARQGWADALAAFSIAGPLFVIVTSLLPFQAVLFHASAPRALPRAVLAGPPWPYFWVMLGLQVLVAALVLAGQRTAALAAMTLAAVYLYLGNQSLPMTWLWWWPSPDLLWSVYLLTAAALFSSPGPRHGRHLMHWGHAVVLLTAAGAMDTLRVNPGYDSRPVLTLVIVTAFAVAVSWLSRVTRLGRYFPLLLAAMLYPTAASLVLAAFPLWSFGLPVAQYVALLYAGPLLTAAIAVISTIRPHGRQAT